MRAQRCLGTSCISPARLQWAPTLTTHDPSPPIVLETPTAGAVTAVLAAALGARTLSSAAAVALGATLIRELGGFTLSGAASVSGVGPGPAPLWLAVSRRSAVRRGRR